MRKNISIYAKIIGTIILSASFFTACNKDNSKKCTYYNKPLPVEVAFVGYNDYEILEFEIHQFEKNSDHENLVKSETISNATVTVKHDTSTVLFTLNNKVDYMITLPQMYDTHYIANINYKPEYFEVVEPSGKCEQSKEYSQLPDSATINNERIPLHILSKNEAKIYIVKH